MQWWRAALAALSLAAAAGAGAEALSEGAAPAQRPNADTVAKVEQSLLAMLGLRRRPKPPPAGQKVFVPEAMLAIYEQLSHPDSDNPLPPPFVQESPLQHRIANTVRSFTHQESAIDKRFKGHHKFRLAFNVSVPDNEALKAAELVLNRDSVRHPPNNGVADDRDEKHRVLVYDIVKPGVKGESRPELKLLDSKWVKTARAGSVHLDVTGAAERWMWNPQQNHGLLVYVTTSQGSTPSSEERPHVRLRRSSSDSGQSWQSRQPVLLAFTDDGRARLKKPEADAAPSRRTRAAGGRGRGKNHHHRRRVEACQRRALYVDFEEVGWSNWIVAPPGYDAYYCHGDCPFPLPDHFNSTNHAIVQTLLNSVDQMAVPKACCVPTTLSAISMLYMDEERKVVLKNYQDMAVEGCGCR